MQQAFSRNQECLTQRPLQFNKTSPQVVPRGGITRRDSNPENSIPMKMIIGSDHGGFALKEVCRAHIATLPEWDITELRWQIFS